MTQEENMNEQYLEPRVARLETGLETLTRNVSEIAISMRENTTAINGKIDGLAIAVTQANAPKKTDWGLFISAIGLILALGAAVLIPLNSSTKDNKQQIEAYHSSMIEHQKLDMHRVGSARVDAVVKDMDLIRSDLVKRDTELDNKIQKETQLMTGLLAANIEALDKRLQIEMGLKNEIVMANIKGNAVSIAAHERQDELEQKLAAAELRVVKEKNDLYIEKLFGRVQELEKERIKVADNEHAELMLWRQKAMGLSSPNAVVPLMTREAAPEIKK